MVRGEDASADFTVCFFLRGSIMMKTSTYSRFVSASAPSKAQPLAFALSAALAAAPAARMDAAPAIVSPSTGAPAATAGLQSPAVASPAPSPGAAQVDGGQPNPALPLPPGAPTAMMPNAVLSSLGAVNVLLVPIDDVDIVAAVPDVSKPHLARWTQSGKETDFSFITTPDPSPISAARQVSMAKPTLLRTAALGDFSLRLAQLRLVQMDGGAASGFDAGEGFQSGGVGASQQAAGPLRQALLRQGLSDILSAAPDSAVMRRALNEKRVAPEVLGVLRRAMAQLVALSQPNGAASVEAMATAPGAAIVPEPRAGTTTAPESAQDKKERWTIEATQSATQAAVQLGQAMNYRAVVVLAVVPERRATGGAAGGGKATYALLSVDAVRESATFSSFEAAGATVLSRNQAAAQTAAQGLARRLLELRPLTARERSQRVDEYLKTARAALERGATPEAVSNAKQAIALEPARSASYVVLGDALKDSDPRASADAYKKALAGGGRESGGVWARMAVAYAQARDWPSTMKSGQRALALKFDSASLRGAMATAQFGRAELFRNAGREDSALAAEADGQEHLNRARELAPDDPDIARLFVAQLVAQGQYKAALQILDALAPKYPNDLALQTVYATALLERGERNADAFAAWSRVWKMKGVQSVPLDARLYNRMVQGFDEYVADLARQARLEVDGVAAGTMPREAALLRVTRWSALMDDAKSAIGLILAPENIPDSLHAARVLAADLLSQALDEERVYLETGDDLHRSRATDLHRQAILRLNAARTAG